AESGRGKTTSRPAPISVPAQTKQADMGNAANQNKSETEGPPPQSANAATDPAEIWKQVCAKIAARGFLRTLVDSLTVVGAEGRAFILGYPPDEKSAIETLATTSNRRQLESLLCEISGRDWTVKLEARDGV